MGSESVFLLILVTGITFGTNDRNASRQAQNAYMRYTGVDSMVADYAKSLQKGVEREAPEEVRLYLGSALFLSKTIVEHKLVVRWSF